MWETNESMSQEDIESAALNSYDLPEDVRIIDVGRSHDREARACLEAFGRL